MTTEARHYLPPELAQFDPGELAAPHFEAARWKKLVIQRCQACATFQHPPRDACSSCRSFDLHWAEVPGTGTIYTYTVVYHPIGPLRDHVPYNIVTVLLDEAGVRLVSNVVDADPSDLDVGLPVEVVFEDFPEMSLPRFRLVG
jgi:uncharacterized OB-fold protein